VGFVFCSKKSERKMMKKLLFLMVVAGTLSAMHSGDETQELTNDTQAVAVYAAIITQPQATENGSRALENELGKYECGAYVGTGVSIIPCVFGFAFGVGDPVNTVALAVGLAGCLFGSASCNSALTLGCVRGCVRDRN
jgi:hypothetical protein